MFFGKRFLFCTAALSLLLASLTAQSAEALNPNHVRWDVYPTAIRADGQDSFVIRVHIPQAVTSVQLKVRPGTEGQTKYVKPAPTSFTPITLKDDGQGADQLAGDRIFTAGPFKYDTTKTFPANMGSDSKSPTGIYQYAIGNLAITFQDSATYSFGGQSPVIGLVKSDVPAATVTDLSATVSAASHMIGVRYDTAYAAANLLRYYTRTGDSDLTTGQQFVRSLYTVLPEQFDQMLLYPTYDILAVRNGFGGMNGVSGIHHDIVSNVQGIGKSLFNDSANWGTTGKLKNVSVFANTSAGFGLMVQHEISHTWEAYIAHPVHSLANLTPSNYGHWNTGNSISEKWRDNGNGTFTLVCDGSEYTSSTNMLQYLMGVIAPAQTQPVRVLTGDTSFGPGYECNKTITRSFATVPIEEIIAANGQRVPAAAQAQKDFRLLYVVQTFDRKLTATEMTYHNVLAKHLSLTGVATGPIAGTAVPWRPLPTFFTGTTWRTDVPTGGGGPDTIAPVITLNGAATMQVAKGTTFTDPGATAQDNVDGDITSKIVVTGSVNTAVVGTYTLRYNVKDNAGNFAPEVTRTVNVVEQQACVKSTNYQHVNGGRAYARVVNFVNTAFAKGSNNNLGSVGSQFFSPTTTLKNTGPDFWVKVTSCS